MDNYIFSTELELSVIEYRLLNIFETCERLEIKYFFPGLIFNETFWQNPAQKREVIFQTQQQEWLSDNPLSQSVLYIDEMYLEIIKSVKISYFSYTKLDLKALIELFKTPTKFSLSEFVSFGDQNNSLISKINEIYYKNRYLYETDVMNELGNRVAKLSAVKFYTKFSKKDSISILGFMIERKDLNYFEDFFLALKTIDGKQNTNLLSNLKIFFTHKYQFVLDEISELFKNFKTLSELFTQKQISLDELNPVEFELANQFDYIFANGVLTTLPTNILTISKDGFYDCLGRLCYAKGEDVKQILEKAALFEVPHTDQIDAETFSNLDYEVIFEKFTNQNVINLINEHVPSTNNSYIKFSIPALTFLIKTISALKKYGYIEIWESGEEITNRNIIGLRRDESGKLVSTVNLSLYLSILSTFDDIKIKPIHSTYQEVISEGVFNKKNQIVGLESFLQFLVEHKSALKDIFKIDSFKYKKDLEKLTSEIRFFEFLKRKNIMLLGFPSYLYRVGQEKFSKKVQKQSSLSKNINPKDLTKNNLKSYNIEYLVTLIASLLSTFTSKKDVVISSSYDSFLNKEFFAILDDYGFEKEKIFEEIKKYWEELSLFAKYNTNYELLTFEN